MRANQAPFINKEIQWVLMVKSKLRKMLDNKKFWKTLKNQKISSQMNQTI